MPRGGRHFSPGVRSTASSQGSRDYQTLEQRHWERFFVPGRIFMYQLYEHELDDYNKKQRLLVPKVSSKTVYRRCVVVKGGQESSQCLQVYLWNLVRANTDKLTSQIKTYENEGCTRRDVRPKQNHHAAVYTGHEAFHLPEETRLRTPIQAEAISHDSVLPRLARLNYDSLFDFSHKRPIYPLAQVTSSSLRTLLYDFEELNPPPIRPLRQTRKRTWDVMLEKLDATSISSPAANANLTPAPRRTRTPVRRAPTFPPPIPEAPQPPQPPLPPPPPSTRMSPRIEIRAPRPEVTPFPVVPANSNSNSNSNSSSSSVTAAAVHVPLVLRSARDPRATAPVSALLLPAGAELNFIDPELAVRLGAALLRYAGPDVVTPRSGIVIPASGVVKVSWSFAGGGGDGGGSSSSTTTTTTTGRVDTDTFVVFPGLPCEVVLGSRTVVEKRWGIGVRDAEVLGLPVLSREDRRNLEHGDRRKPELRMMEKRDNAEIERRFAQQRAALLRH